MKKTRTLVDNYDYNMPSKTDQQFASEVNSNTIMEKAYRGSVITHLRKNQGAYRDVSQMKDLMGTFAAVKKAQETFATLPSELRYLMNNDPRNLPQFMEDANNIEILTAYGMIDEKSADKPSDETAPAVPSKTGKKSPKPAEPASEKED